jgi:hypothetical protein
MNDEEYSYSFFQNMFPAAIRRDVLWLEKRTWPSLAGLQFISNKRSDR